ncbi:hypothetical protein [Cryobacterium fucosi]|uniref:Uncharacterized protein n=1 Tax=Cryobacterium fucosi TaxID=1259157 RepID=A0A4R9BDJ7_9MICO|nr:hypothetical protein [Cryobacterium fucosi]TFD81591.1 hypothetical protein E3T48_03290 [Cryobacterium fucosi]
MTELILPAGILLASLTLTYFFCLRPMRTGKCAMGHAAPGMDHSASSSNDGAELARLRAEVEVLRGAPLGGRGGTTPRA